MFLSHIGVSLYLPLSLKSINVSSGEKFLKNSKNLAKPRSGIRSLILKGGEIGALLPTKECPSTGEG